MPRPKAATDQEVVEAVEEIDRPVVTVSNVAEYLGVSWVTANEYLEELVGKGEIDAITVGKTTAYYRATWGAGT